MNSAHPWVVVQYFFFSQWHHLWGFIAATLHLRACPSYSLLSKWLRSEGGKRRQNVHWIYHIQLYNVESHRWWWGLYSSVHAFWESRGRVLGEGKGLLSCLHALCRQLKIPFDSFKVEREKPKQDLADLFAPALFVRGERKTVLLNALWWLGLALCQCGGWHAGSVHAYHVHNRANEHSSTMKAQRERLRIPGLTLEWVFSSVILPSWRRSSSAFSFILQFVFVFHCCFMLCVVLAIAAACHVSLKSDFSQLAFCGLPVYMCVCVSLLLCFCAHMRERICHESRVPHLHSMLYAAVTLCGQDTHCTPFVSDGINSTAVCLHGRLALSLHSHVWLKIQVNQAFVVVPFMGQMRHHAKIKIFK